ALLSRARLPRPPPYPYTTLFRSANASSPRLGRCPTPAPERVTPARVTPAISAARKCSLTFDSGVARGAGSSARHLEDAMQPGVRSEEHTLNSSHQIISYAVFCLK